MNFHTANFIYWPFSRSDKATRSNACVQHRAPPSRWRTIFLLLALYPGPLTLATGAAQPQKLPVHVPREARAKPLGRLAADKRLDLVLTLPLRNRESLGNLLQRLYDPASPQYRQYLTPNEFARQFGPAESDYQALLDFAQSHHLTVTATHANRTLLDVRGTVADVEKTFHTTLRLYQHPKESRTFFAPDVEPTVELAVPLLAVSGLDDFSVPRPMNLHPGLSRPALRAPRPLGGGRPVPYATGSAPRGNFMGADFRRAYAPGVSLDGRGQTVGLVAFDGYYPSDIAAYENLAGLPNVPLTNIVLNGVSGNPGMNNVEVALDVDMAIAMAPGLSQVIVYEGSVPNDVLNRMATDNLAKQLSSSWAFGDTLDETRDQIYQQFAAQGQSMFQASGDYGAYGGAVIAPSDNPYITVVGGTSLTTTNGAWFAETTWPGSGGGISSSFPIPAWQQGLDFALNQGSASLRNIPDVAGVADSVIWLVANNGEEGAVGGTSAAAPLWAGFAALVNQQAALTGKPSVGFLNPALYAIGMGTNYPAAFHDITTGNNINGSSNGKFIAVPGYDLCTGWGTPTGSNLIAALLAPPVALRIEPLEPITFSGPVGGPFNPASAIYTLTNTTHASLDWDASDDSAWLDLSSDDGTLAPGGPVANLQAQLNSTAATLTAGTYMATLSFVDSSDTRVQQRLLVLQVMVSPAITTQPYDEAVLQGMTANFSITTPTNGGLSYQWYFDNGVFQTNLSDSDTIFGSASSTLTISNVSPANIGAYSVLVSNALGIALSSNAFLSIVPWRPVITMQPTNQVLLPGQTASLVVVAAGSQPLYFQWLKDGTRLNDGGSYSGVTTPTLTINNISESEAGNYSVLVTNSMGNTTSASALLTVRPVTAPGTVLASVYSFEGGADGAGPNGLFLANDGYLYGTTASGGSNSLGAIFQFTTNAQFTPLYSFAGNDGASPLAPLAQGIGGELYGTAFQGGAFDNGAIFRISQAGIISTLLSFNITNGDFPHAGLTLGRDGSFYSTTYQGGDFGRGTAFKITPAGQFTTLYSFQNDIDGGHPYAGLLQGSDSAFYGTTYKAGVFDAGTVFRITTNGLFASLVSFDSTNGSFPYAGLAQDRDGNFFGTTSYGGSNNLGTVFRLTPTWQLTTLHAFGGVGDGRLPATALFPASDGNFYGTTEFGGLYDQGTVFRLSPDGVLTTLAHFDGSNGSDPRSALIQAGDGNLYGTTHYGGVRDQGTIFRISFNGPPQITSQPASQTVFAGASVRFSPAISGSMPFFFQWLENGTNLYDAGNISGSVRRILTLTNVSVSDRGSYSVIISNAFGSVTSAPAFLQVTSSVPFIVVQPTNQTVAPGSTVTLAVRAFGDLPLVYQWQKNGTNVTDGGELSGSSSGTLTIAHALEPDNGDYQVIVTNSLGALTSSVAVVTVVPVSAPGTRLTTLYWFQGGDDGARPNGLMQHTNGNFYGTTWSNGPAGVGTVFTVSTNGAVTTIIPFRGINGAFPRSPLVPAADGTLWGTTQSGGAVDQGIIFQVTTKGALSVFHSFTGGVDGANPLAAPTLGEDNHWYGLAPNGGAAGFGDIFRLAPDGSLTTLYSFTNGVDGGLPTAGLVRASDGNYYGTTPAGGAFGKGNIFKLTPAGTVSNIYSFTGAMDGSCPAGTLVEGTDGNLYGTTRSNRIGNYQFYGTFFKVTTAGRLTTLYMLNYQDGAYPAAGLVQANDGNFYGTTHDGGIFGPTGNGTLIGLAPNGSFANLLVFDGFNSGAHPETALIQGADGSLYGTTSSGGPGGQGTLFRFSFTGPPFVTAPPLNQTVLAGTSARLSVAVFGAPPLVYQWLKNGTNLLDGPVLSGVTNRILNLRNVSVAEQGAYSVTVSNSLGSVTSSVALVTIVSPPVVQAAARPDGNLVLTWPTVAGQSYQLQSKDDLEANTWTNLGNPLTATGSTLTYAEPLGANPQRFYRVILLFR